MIDGDLLRYVPTAGRADEPGGVQAEGVQKADGVRGEIGECVTPLVVNPLRISQVAAFGRKLAQPDRGCLCR